MKRILPQNILLLIAILTVALTISYNFFGRNSLSVMVDYRLPDPSPAQQSASVSSSYPSSAVEVNFPLELNSATATELSLIPEIGSVLAQRIVVYRTQIRGFKNIQQLKDVEGIGDKTFELISQYLYLKKLSPPNSSSRASSK